MTNSPALSSLASSGSAEELLNSLKDLKNSVIGNTWKKVQIAEDQQLLSFLLSRLSHVEVRSPQDVEIANEVAVIIGALANVGTLTARPLLLADTPSCLLDRIHDITSTPFSSAYRLLPALLRALRNVLVSTADLEWGHVWGVGSEREVVGTGLEDMEGDVKGKRPVRVWKSEARRALGIILEPESLDTLLGLLKSSNPQILLPIYQAYARLIALPSHREALASWRPGANDPGPSTGGGSYHDPPYIIVHLLAVIAEPERSPKLLEAALELLAALVKGQPELAAIARSWAVDDDDPRSDMVPGLLGVLVDMLSISPAGIPIGAASCLTNIMRADKGSKTHDRVRSTVINLQLLMVIAKLLRSEGPEDRVKLCFVLAALVSDDEHLQKTAAQQGCPGQLIALMQNLDREEESGAIGSDLASRSREAMLLALASLCFQHEPTRSLIAEVNPPFLPRLHSALSHPSYGVRAAACQLARALSRTVAILRTSLVDSKVGAEIIQVLKREMADPKDADELGERAWTVEVAATATICNLIADFSPLKAFLLQNGGIEVLCQLSHSAYEPLALNALWALKNLTFHATDILKAQVMAVLTWSTLQTYIGPLTRLSLRVQSFEVVQNLLADAGPGEIYRTIENLGGEEFLAVLELAARDGSEVDLRVPALYVLSNIAIGNERTRALLIARVGILEALSSAIYAKSDCVKTPALRCLRHLVASNARSQRPRQSVLDALYPYQLKPRLKELAETSPSLDVCQAAVGLLEVMERGRDLGSVGVLSTR
ncbi:armadillo-type protein, partial [Naematelia encephala]